MNDYLNIKRLGKCLAYDIRSAKNNYGISLIVIGLLPVYLFLFDLLFNNVLGEESMPAHIFALVCASIIAVISFPVKTYGLLTEKKAGSQFLMLPASSLEKWISMLVVTCIVLPVCLFILVFGSDAILSLLWPKLYGDSLLKFISNGINSLYEVTEGTLNIHFLPLSFLTWSCDILIFTLGALIFKKGKASKTILACMCLGTIISFLSFKILGSWHFSYSDNFILSFGDLELDGFIRRFNTLINISFMLILVPLLAGTYARIKTLKH